MSKEQLRNEFLMLESRVQELEDMTLKQHFKVDFAKTERLKKSSIISIQTQLNED